MRVTLHGRSRAIKENLLTAGRVDVALRAGEADDDQSTIIARAAPHLELHERPAAQRRRCRQELVMKRALLAAEQSDGLAVCLLHAAQRKLQIERV